MRVEQGADGAFDAAGASAHGLTIFSVRSQVPAGRSARKARPPFVHGICTVLCTGLAARFWYFSLRPGDFRAHASRAVLCTVLVIRWPAVWGRSPGSPQPLMGR